MELYNIEQSSNITLSDKRDIVNCDSIYENICKFNEDLTLEFSNITNEINSTQFPPSLSYDDRARKEIIAYSILLVIAAIGNLTVLCTLLRHKHWKSRVNLMIMHLVTADLMVTFITIPLEIGWRITTQWLAGNFACKLLLFLRAFGLYSSSLVLVCIGLDRYFAILYPLRVSLCNNLVKLFTYFSKYIFITYTYNGHFINP